MKKPSTYLFSTYDDIIAELYSKCCELEKKLILSVWNVGELSVDLIHQINMFGSLCSTVDYIVYLLSQDEIFGNLPEESLRKNLDTVCEEIEYICGEKLKHDTTTIYYTKDFLSYLENLHAGIKSKKDGEDTIFANIEILKTFCLEAVTQLKSFESSAFYIDGRIRGVLTKPRVDVFPL